MRLTLRTMLAYMDEILEPEDHQDISRKIEESEFASNLVHRIRDVSRRMRLAAPKVAGRGMGLDPNTVAEYIDNELPGERVPDFEKVCLESDIHLAEVACCHQILALVQVQPAEVDPDLRRRMYDMGLRADDAADASEERVPTPPPALPPVSTAAAFAATDSAPRHDDAVEPVRSRPEVPDYLRSSTRSKFWPVTIIAVLAVCLVGAIILASGPLDGTNPVLKLFGLGSEPVAKVDPAKKGDQPVPASTTSGTATSGTGTSGSGTLGTGTLGTGTSGTSDKTGGPIVAPDANPAGKTPVPADKTGPDQPAKSPADGVDPGKGPAAPDKSGQPPAPTELPAVAGPGPTDDKHAPVPPIPMPDNGTVPPTPRPDDAAAGKPPVPGTPPGVAVAPGGPSPFDQAEQRIGRLLSNDQEVLLRMAAGKTDWHRLAQGGTFNSGDKLLVLPTFRPMVTLAAGITLQLAPETMIEFDGIEQGIPVVRVDYGRMVVMTTGKADVKIKLALGDSAGTISFDDAEATIGVEVRPYHLPGVDPETHQPRLAIAIYGVSGEVSWNPGGGEKAQKIHAPARLVLAADPLQPAADREVPKWVGAEPISPLEVRASQSLNESLDEKRPVTQTLLEMAGHRREENRSLAARSLALIDEFEPFDGLLKDDKERSVWPVQIESLQAALARGPAVAAKVRAVFEKERGKDGTELYRMLWGYCKDDLANGAAVRLVEYLDDDNLDFRVLAFQNLKNITGTTFNYRPEQSAANRQQPIRRWKEQLKDGLIGPKTAPAAKAPAIEPPAGKTVPAPPMPDAP